MSARPVILVLAAGASRRMRGADKLLEEVDGEPVLRRTVRAALGTGSDVIVALPADAPARDRVIEGLPVSRIAVPDAAEGMSASLRAGAAACPEGRALMVALADMPELGTDDFRAVAQAFDDAGGRHVVRAAAADGTPGQPVIFPAHLVPRLLELRGDAGGREIVAAEGALLVPRPGTRATTDLDTPEAWAAWRSARS